MPRYAPCIFYAFQVALLEKLAITRNKSSPPSSLRKIACFSENEKITKIRRCYRIDSFPQVDKGNSVTGSLMAQPQMDGELVMQN
jgi:hypothetical protein